MTHLELSRRLEAAAPSVVPYLTAGFPDMPGFLGHLSSLAAIAPAIEVGIPFSDPMADGATIQESSQAALASGVTLRAILDELDRTEISTPLVAMTYLNPLLAFGLEEVMARFAGVGVAALVIPDLPYEESAEVAGAAGSESVGLVQLVTPITDADRLETLCRVSEGFVYAVTMTGTTGSSVGDLTDIGAYLDRVRSYSAVPVLAGFGIRQAAQVDLLTDHCDGVIVGSAIVELVARGEDPVPFVEGLKP
ncbi:MAG TPA: tryptophan synthase subunit alpha [Acidimicrobiia bacterium]